MSLEGGAQAVPGRSRGGRKGWMRGRCQVVLKGEVRSRRQREGVWHCWSMGMVREAIFVVAFLRQSKFRILWIHSAQVTDVCNW